MASGVRGCIEVLAIVTFLTAGNIGAAHGQSDVQRKGLWGGIEAGPAVLSLSCDGCPTEGSDLVPHLGLHAGFTLNPTLLLAAELNAWRRSDRIDTGLQLAASVYWYPSRRGNWFVKAGAGPAMFRGEQRAGGITESGSGVGIVFGTGLELRAGRSISIGPALTLTHEAIGDTRIAGGTFRTGVNSTGVALSFAVTFH